MYEGERILLDVTAGAALTGCGFFFIVVVVAAVSNAGGGLALRVVAAEALPAGAIMPIEGFSLCVPRAKVLLPETLGGFAETELCGPLLVVWKLRFFPCGKIESDTDLT